MKITFLLPYAGMAGGIRVIAIYTNLLVEAGHDVQVISVSRSPLSLKDSVRRWLKGERVLPGQQKQGPSHMENIDSLRWWVIEKNGPLIDADVPDSDVVIATWWKTAEWLNGLNDKKGRKVYFCQGYETSQIFSIDRVQATYRLPFFQICVSSWVKRMLYELTGQDNQEVVMNGVDTVQFFDGERSKNSIPKFGFVFSEANCKGNDIIIGALIKAKKIEPSISAICFGARFPSLSQGLPNWIEFYHNPTQNHIREIYAQCDAWLFGSRAEGFGLPILEAMACGTPVIATPAGAAPDLVNEKNGFLVGHEDSQIMADKMIQIGKLSNDQWKLLSSGARRTSVDHSWDLAAESFEKILFRMVES